MPFFRGPKGEMSESRWEKQEHKEWSGLLQQAEQALKSGGVNSILELFDKLSYTHPKDLEPQTADVKLRMGKFLLENSSDLKIITKILYKVENLRQTLAEQIIEREDISFDQISAIIGLPGISIDLKRKALNWIKENSDLILRTYGSYGDTLLNIIQRQDLANLKQEALDLLFTPETPTQVVFDVYESTMRKGGELKERAKKELVERGIRLFVRYDPREGGSGFFVPIFKDKSGQEFEGFNALVEDWLGKQLEKKPLLEGDELLEALETDRQVYYARA